MFDRRSLLAGLGLMAAVPSTTGMAAAPPDALDLLARDLRRECDRLAREDDFSGSVLLTHAGRTVLQASYGLANRNAHLPNTARTRFNLASISKMFTAVAVLRLVEAGKLTLDTRVGQVLTNYPNRTVADQVTVEQLLTHTSGIGNYWEQISRVRQDKLVNLSDTLALFAEAPLEHAPGSTFSYSNGGYVVLGLIIERITGADYFDHIRETLLRPLNMNHTDAYRLDEVVPDLVVGYTRDLEQPGVWRNNQFSDVFRGSSAGGYYSTTGDMLAFARALTAHQLLGPGMTAAFTLGRHPYAKGLYGYGCSEETVNGHRIIGHSGGHFGIAGELMVFEDLDTVFIILSNGEVDPYFAINDLVKRHLVGESAASRNYAFTRAVIAAVDRADLNAGLAASRQPDTDAVLREGVIDVEAWKRLHQGRTATALALFQLNATVFHGSSDARWNLAQALRVAGRKAEAIDAYRNYLTLVPDDPDATSQLARLTG
jgi:D-alanyl-D-alanine carboxypeptidase